MLRRPAAIPRESGCYLFRNAAGVVIYVGKARSLVQRLSNYFQRPEVLAPKTRALMSEAMSVEWIVTPSELDALILENELIKANQPRYNMRLKDDKTYPFVAIDPRAEFPVPYVTRSQRSRGVRYFGPFGDVRALRRTMDELLFAFPLRTCSRHKFDYQRRVGRPCLLFDLGKCAGPCVGRVSSDDYQALVASWMRFFEGDVRPLRTRLTAEMSEASAEQRYEAAARARDALAALERAAADQSVIVDDHTSADVLTAVVEGNRAAVVRLDVRHGRIVGRRLQLVDRALDEPAATVLEAALPEIYDEASSVPGEVIAPAGLVSDLARQWLSARAGGPVRVTCPQRGRRRRVLALADGDAAAAISRDARRREFDHNVRSRALQELGSALGLGQPPYRVECYDMSHLQGTNYVGSMVVFEDGLPKRRDYRHFNVREVRGNDDVGAMGEVLRRRLAHWDDGPGGRFAPADLVIVDGGVPQLHAAQDAVEQAGLSGRVVLAALAKREELLFRPGSPDPVVLERGSEALYLVQRLRDEAHRFAITFHRSKRGRAMVASTLDGVTGLGPARRERLIETFGSLEGIRAATREDLAGLSWLPTTVADALYDHLAGGPTTPTRTTEGDD